MHVHRDAVTRTVYSTDNSIYQIRPTGVGLPASADEIATLLRRNHQRDKPHPIVARGGGTGTNGQSLTDGVVVDLKRKMGEVLSVDVARARAVVQPGLVTAELNAMLADHGLFWAPHTSTLNRATVGGMISTDAAGKGSLVHGRAHRHIEQLVMLLDDGSSFTAEEVTEAEAQRRAANPDRSGEIWRALLGLELPSDGELGLPELARGFSGYGIDRLRSNGMINPIAVICGAEGTLGVIVEATLILTDLPASTRLVVACYASFADALDDAVELRLTGPSAIESFDETTLDRGRSSPAWPALGAVVGERRGAVLLLEYIGEVDSAEIDARLASTGRCIAHGIVDAAADQAAIWKVRADAVGLLAKVSVGGPALDARPTAFVEDCAVPVAAMPTFIAEFRSLLDEAGLTYGMFGHADVGCVHVRPALDLTDPDHRELVTSVTERVTELVQRHGGIVWGEHGRGFRGAHVDQILPRSTIELMRAIKTAFDPLDIFNPGKLYRPFGAEQPVLAVDDPSMRGEANAEVAVQLRRDFDHAFSCNGNGLCHHYGGAEVMCPSYKATGDPALSPKGRADLIRAWLRGNESEPSFEHDLAENLDQCLSCSACTGRCPVEVDIPELKSRFFESYYQRHRRPLSHLLLSRFEALAGLASRAPRLMGWGVGPAAKLLGLVDLPAPPSTRQTPLPAFTGQSGLDVIVVADVFTSVLEPGTLASSVRVLESLGYSTAVAGLVSSGKFDHVKGQRDRFAKAADRQRVLVEQICSAGAVPTVIEPAVALLHDHEYPQAVPGYPSGAVVPIAKLVANRLERLDPLGRGQNVTLLGHCTERSTSPESARLWGDILEAMGYAVATPDIGCCGMAGIFGHEVANQELSSDLWELTWAPVMGSLGDSSMLVAPGYSCRSQAKRFGDEDVIHPIDLVERSAAEKRL